MTKDTRRSTARERCSKLRERYYDDAGYPGPLDRYREAIARHAGGAVAVLDAGCGATMPFLREIAPLVRHAVGVDLERLRRDGAGPDGCRADVGRLPFRDESFDLIISMSVLEHLEDPPAVFRELGRVLRPGGKLVVQTPNRFDYVSLIAHATPFSFHRWIVPRVMNREEEDVFPTRYRANTRGDLARAMKAGGLEPRSIERFNQYPAYLMFSPLAFRLGMLYERLTTRVAALAWLRGWILAVAEKPA
ncbi:MAG TPA: class I SAM-dependent methyltransferase [Candidatus Eisenbacteria bacterium]|nr:class I SAM-dependent methyltransferase [Candidatus Eisenbacteria bacterium]